MSQDRQLFLNQKHQASRVDMVLQWMQQLPLPTWVIYISLLGLFIVFFNSLGWIMGAVPSGRFDLYRSSIPVYPISSIALIDYLNRVARHALATFCSVIEVDDDEYAYLEYQLTTMPRRGVWMTLVISLVVVAVYVANTPYILVWFQQSPLIALLECLFYTFAFGLMSIYFYHVGWQLWMVNRIHSMLTHVDLFNRTPLYAFSVLSSRTGISLLLMNYFGIATDPETFSNIALINVTIVAFVLAVVSFLLPLQRIYLRIAAEKQHLYQKMTQQLGGIIHEIHKADDQQVTNIVRKNAPLLDSITTTRNIIADIPTWPWETGTLIGFVSAVVLPFLARVLVGFAASLLF